MGEKWMRKGVSRGVKREKRGGKVNENNDRKGEKKKI